MHSSKPWRPLDRNALLGGQHPHGRLLDGCCCLRWPRRLAPVGPIARSCRQRIGRSYHMASVGHIFLCRQIIISVPVGDVEYAWYVVLLAGMTLVRLIFTPLRRSWTVLCYRRLCVCSYVRHVMTPETSGWIGKRHFCRADNMHVAKLSSNINFQSNHQHYSDWKPAMFSLLINDYICSMV